MCIFHLYSSRCEDDCSICLAGMNTCQEDVFMLSCGHMFHNDCIAKCKKPLCPICRKQLLAPEAAYLFSHTVIEPLVIKLYGLSAKSVEWCIAIFDMVLDISAARGEAVTNVLWTGVSNFVAALRNTTD